MRVDTEVQPVAVVRDTNLCFLGCRLAFLRLFLDEGVDERRVAPDRIIQLAVDGGRLRRPHGGQRWTSAQRGALRSRPASRPLWALRAL